MAVATLHSPGEVRGAELAGVVGDDLLEAPAAPNEILGDPAGERRGVARRRVLGCDVNLGSGVARRHVDRRVLPRGSLDARQPTDIEAVHLHQLTGAGDVEVALLWWLLSLLRLGWCRGPGDEPETLGRGLRPTSPERARRR